MDNLNEDKSQHINSIITRTFLSDTGKEVLELLQKTYLKRPDYINGLTLDQVAFRSGQSDVIRQILKIMEIQ